MTHVTITLTTPGVKNSRQHFHKTSFLYYLSISHRLPQALCSLRGAVSIDRFSFIIAYSSSVAYFPSCVTLFVRVLIPLYKDASLLFFFPSAVYCSLERNTEYVVFRSYRSHSSSSLSSPRLVSS